MDRTNQYRDYLGDGVYAFFDGYHIWLETTREGGVVHAIALEAPVWRALLNYQQRLVDELTSKG